VSRCIGPTAIHRGFSSLAAPPTAAQVPLTQQRLDELLEAEITILALQESQPMTLQNILDNTDDAVDMARLLHTELPVRYAQRIKMLEGLPEWQNKAPITHVRQMYITSFKELRMADPLQAVAFEQQLRSIKKRHSHTNLLVGGFKQYAQMEELGEMQINEWLDRFFALRVSANMLISHYLELAAKGTGNLTSLDGGGGLNFYKDDNPYQSSVSAMCDPYKIARHAAHVIEKLCTAWYGCSPEIHVSHAGIRAPFPFVPRYLFYILSELLKNAVRATVETHRGENGDCSTSKSSGEMVPIQVLVSSSPEMCSIRISDEGGGIPVDALDHIWSYLYTTATPVELPMSRASVDAPTDLRRLEMSALPSLHSHSLADGDEEQSMLMRSPLAGLGCGLPLSRLYARYLGGDVRLHTLPRFGTDVFVYLNRLDSLAEHLPAL